MARNRGGRPRFAPTKRHRLTVEEMVFCGERRSAIARAIGIDEDTLRKHFADELENGTARRAKEVVGLLFKSARKGNVSAQKKLEELGRTAQAAEAIDRRGASPETKDEPIGKKAARQAAAGQIGGIFATPPPPKLVVSND